MRGISMIPFRVQPGCMSLAQCGSAECVAETECPDAVAFAPSRLVWGRTGFIADAGGGNRTHTLLREPDFESGASASSATPAIEWLKLYAKNHAVKSGRRRDWQRTTKLRIYLRRCRRAAEIPEWFDLWWANVYALTYMATVKKQSLAGGSADRMFRAFSDRTRLRILHLLLNGELCVCDIVRVLEMSQPKISRHLAYLRKSGLVQARKDGLWMHYKLVPADDDFHQSLMNCLRQCFKAVPELQRDQKRLGPQACGPECCD